MISVLMRSYRVLSSLGAGEMISVIIRPYRVLSSLGAGEIISCTVILGGW